MAQQDVPVFSVETALATASDAKDSLDGIDLALGQYESGTVAFVRVTNTYYYYDETSVAPADGVTVVAPLSGPGRWLLLSSAVAPGTCTVIRVVQDGSGDFTTIEDALAFANANATAAEPYTIVVCPGSYVPDVTLAFDNQYVSMRAAQPMTVAITASPGVTPLMQLGIAGGASFYPSQCFEGLVLSRVDEGDLIEVTNDSTSFVFFRDCMLLGDEATGLRSSPAMAATIIFNASYAIGVSATSGDGVCVISGSTSLTWNESAMFSVGRVGHLLSNLSSLQVADVYVDSVDATATVLVEAGLFQGINALMQNSSGGTPWNVLCDGPSAQARLADMQLDYGGLRASQQSGGQYAFIRAVGCFIESADTGLQADDGRIVAANCVVSNTATPIFISGLATPRIYIVGGDIPITPGAAPITGLSAFTGDQQGDGDALVAYNGDAPARQLRLDQEFTPANSADAAGVQGNVAWDDSYVYVKTSVGWKRAALVAF